MEVSHTESVVSTNPAFTAAEGPQLIHPSFTPEHRSPRIKAGCYMSTQHKIPKVFIRALALRLCLKLSLLQALSQACQIWPSFYTQCPGPVWPPLPESPAISGHALPYPAKPPTHKVIPYHTKCLHAAVCNPTLQAGTGVHILYSSPATSVHLTSLHLSNL